MPRESLTELLRDAMPLNKAAEYFPTRPHISQMHRWCNDGVRGVKLESWMVGGERVTTLAAIERFLEALNAGARQQAADVGQSERSKAATKALEQFGC